MHASTVILVIQQILMMYRLQTSYNRFFFYLLHLDSDDNYLIGKYQISLFYIYSVELSQFVVEQKAESEVKHPYKDIVIIITSFQSCRRFFPLIHLLFNRQKMGLSNLCCFLNLHGNCFKRKAENIIE